MKLFWKSIPSPVGGLKLVAHDSALTAILWESEPVPESAEEARDHPVLRKCEKQLGEYFAGRRREFSVKVDLRGTEFQKRVWQELLSIPHGETGTYARIAAQAGRPKAVRAAGAAIGRNPIPIIVPCHRVIGCDGKLTGFAGGLKIKKILLSLEAA